MAFPQERAPPPRDEGCKQNGFGNPAPHASNGSPPTPSPPSKSSPPSSASTSFPTLVTMGGIAPVDACPPPAVLTEWRCYACHDSIGGSNMVNLCSGEQLWQPPASDWDVLKWDIEYTPNPKGTWYRVPGSRLGCLFLQESSGFLCFPFLWHFFHRNLCNEKTTIKLPLIATFCFSFYESSIPK